MTSRFVPLESYVAMETGGESWIRVCSAQLRAVDRLVVHPRRGSTLYAIGGGAIYRTRDAGVTWDRLPLSGRPLSGDFVDLAIDPARPTRLTAVSILYCSPHCDLHYSLVYHSTDGGDTWRLLRRLPFVVIVEIEVDPLDPAVVYAGAYGTGSDDRNVLKSVDRGRTWRAAGGGGRLRHADVRDVAVDPAHFGTVYPGTNGSLYRSDDGGAS